MSTVRSLPIKSIQNPALQKLAQTLETTAGVGTKDGVITSAEVEKALKLAETKPDKFGDLQALKALQTFLVHMGSTSGGPAAGSVSAGGYSPLAVMGGQIQGATLAKVKDPFVLSASQGDAVSQLFQVPSEQRTVADKQSVLVPLQGKELHVIELEYQDTRKLRDLEFNYKTGNSYEWKTFRGDQWDEMVAREKKGEVQIRRESDHNEPWINNPVRVKVDILFPDGKVFEVGKKFLDFHVHDAHGPDSSGYAETDNINRTYESLPSGKLPDGCLLRLTPLHENRKSWEKDRETAMELRWVKPQYILDYKSKETIFSGGGFKKIDPQGYPVDPKRTIAAVMVTWTDYGKPYSGSVSIGKDEKGQPWRSPSLNVASGETKLIPVNHKAKDGRIKIEGSGVDVSQIQVLYAD